MKLQKKILRVITFSHFKDHTELLFNSLRIMKFQKLNRFLTAIFMFKVVHGLLPVIVQNIFFMNMDVHTHVTRQRYNFHIFPCRTTLLLFSLNYHGSKVWNNLPLYLRQIDKFGLFKRKLRFLVLD